MSNITDSAAMADKPESVMAKLGEIGRAHV